ncbi:sigma-54-dependent transcriptional regulator [Yoonia sp. 208BN28-4]|uniref:sigma-54-dependent transcriptional regulator n=1 Tax=Yoonia sp. 208BN28-4 TaxID=3126505 RepID=UPI0030A126BF
MTKTVLLVEDEPEIRAALEQTLMLADLTPRLAGSFVAAKDQIRRDFDGVVVTDVRMPGRDGFFLLDHVRQIDPELPVILLTGEADVPMAVRAMAAGAFDFLEKPCAPKDFLSVIERALAARAQVLDNRRRKIALDSGDAAERMIFGQSAKSTALRDKVRSVARVGGEVLLTGDQGSGTSKIAEVIHLLSAAAPHPFVKRAGASLGSAAVAEALDAAANGTLYIDEVSAMPAEGQFALLERLETGGGARVIAATTRPIEDAVQNGAFHGDLFYRLDLLRVRIPALRERPEDIPVLFRDYVAQACEQANLPMPDITPDVTARLMAQDWPGNARALMNTAMRFVMGLHQGDDPAGLGLAEQMAQMERALLVGAMQRHNGRVTDIVVDLKLPRKTFYDKLAKHGLRAEDYRA